MNLGISTARQRADAHLRGFTLIELMVIVAILAILASIGFPGFQQMIASYRVRTAASAVYEALLVARSEAVKRNATAQFDYGGGTLSGGWSVTAGGETVHVQGPITGMSLDPGAPAIAFNARGRPSALSAIEITAAGTKFSRCVRVELSGSPSVIEGDCP